MDCISLGSQRVGDNWTTFTLVALVVKNLPASAGYIRDKGSIPGSGRFPGGEGNSHPLQWSCLEKSHSGVQWATLHRVTKSWTWLKRFSTYVHSFMHWKRKWQPTPVFLPGESQGQGSLVAAVYGVAQSWTWLKRLSSSTLISKTKN